MPQKDLLNHPKLRLARSKPVNSPSLEQYRMGRPLLLMHASAAVGVVGEKGAASMK